jgi:hypothetical protein
VCPLRQPPPSASSFLCPHPMDRSREKAPVQSGAAGAAAQFNSTTAVSSSTKSVVLI